MKFKGALFDMDGLMFDTENLINDAMRIAGKEMHLPVTDTLLMSMKGINKQGCTIRMLTAFGMENEEELLPFRSRIMQLRAERLKAYGVPVKKGLYNLLTYLKYNDYKIGLATSTSDDIAESMLKEANVYHYFDNIVYGNQVINGKPFPDIYLKCACDLELSPEECIVFEDAPSGIEAGYKAGAKVIMIPDCVPPSDKEKKRCLAILKDLGQAVGFLHAYDNR